MSTKLLAVLYWLMTLLLIVMWCVMTTMVTMRDFSFFPSLGLIGTYTLLFLLAWLSLTVGTNKIIDERRHLIRARDRLTVLLIKWFDYLNSRS